LKKHLTKNAQQTNRTSDEEYVGVLIEYNKLLSVSVLFILTLKLLSELGVYSVKMSCNFVLMFPGKLSFGLHYLTNLYLIKYV
jgi:hypothetical protein